MPLREVLVRAGGGATIVAAKAIYREGEQARMLVGMFDSDCIQL